MLIRRPSFSDNLLPGNKSSQQRIILLKPTDLYFWLPSPLPNTYNSFRKILPGKKWKKRTNLFLPLSEYVFIWGPSKLIALCLCAASSQSILIACNNDKCDMAKTSPNNPNRRTHSYTNNEPRKRETGRTGQGEKRARLAGRPGRPTNFTSPSFSTQRLLLLITRSHVRAGPVSRFGPLVLVLGRGADKSACPPAGPSPRVSSSIVVVRSSV